METSDKLRHALHNLPVFISLHKVCNYSGSIPDSPVHTFYIWSQYSSIFIRILPPDHSVPKHGQVKQDCPTIWLNAPLVCDQGESEYIKLKIISLITLLQEDLLDLEMLVCLKDAAVLSYKQRVKGDWRLVRADLIMQQVMFGIVSFLNIIIVKAQTLKC